LLFICLKYLSFRLLLYGSWLPPDLSGRAREGINYQNSPFLRKKSTISLILLFRSEGGIVVKLLNSEFKFGFQKFQQ